MVTSLLVVQQTERLKYGTQTRDSAYIPFMVTPLLFAACIFTKMCKCKHLISEKFTQWSNRYTEVKSLFSGRLNILILRNFLVLKFSVFNCMFIRPSSFLCLFHWNSKKGSLYYRSTVTSIFESILFFSRSVVSGSRDATLRMWDIDNGQCLHVLMGHVAAVRCVQYDGRRVVSGAYDYMVKVWDPETETCLHTLQGHTNRVYSLQVRANGLPR